MTKYFVYTSLTTLVSLLAILLVITYTSPSRQVSGYAVSNIGLTKGFEKRLSDAIKIRTVTRVKQTEADTASFVELRSFLERNFPLVHKHLYREQINDLSLLYTWQGTDTLSAPILLMAHMDIVPADDSLQWKHHPFEGKISEGYIYGRGTLDIKSGILGILEAVELLLKEGEKPKQTIYLAFGHDEESGIGSGAKAIAQTLEKRNIKLAHVLDEGGVVLKNALPGLNKPVALIGVAEKGAMNVEIVSKGIGGHASMPPAESSVTRLSDAIQKIKNNPFPPALSGATGAMFDYTAPEMDFPYNIIFTNKWLTGPLIKNMMSKKHTTNASIRTTVAVTMLESSSKENVLPSEARAIANLRLLPGTSPTDALEYLSNVIDDTLTEVKIWGTSSSPLDISDTAAPEFRHIRKTVSSVFPEAITAPFLLIALTDSRHFEALTNNIYRFHPAVYEEPEDLSMLHGRDEKISVKNYSQVIKFYYTLIKNSQHMH
ncbi:M20 family peptidase [Cytophagaceae bacterium ABcell3]|nr:M20 family peptidase [Cytophagaceae bacterium ABcell3]